MIVGFRHKGLKRFFEADDRSKLPPDMVERIRDILTALDAANALGELDRPSFRLHALKGDLKDTGQSRCAPIGASSFALTATECQMSISSTITSRSIEMAMKNPSHPGRLIRDDLDELGISVAEAAAGLGVTRQQLYRVIKGENAISPDMALRLEKAIGSTADFWLRLQMNYDLAQARLREPAVNVSKLEPKAA
jgi:addiction module HigA family antidote